QAAAHTMGKTSPQLEVAGVHDRVTARRFPDESLHAGNRRTASSKCRCAKEVEIGAFDSRVSRLQHPVLREVLGDAGIPCLDHAKRVIGGRRPSYWSSPAPAPAAPRR